MANSIENNIFNDFSSDQTVSEVMMKKKPTETDEKNVKKILFDFGIKKIEIPKFNTRLELQHFMREKIREKLNEP